MFIIEIAKIKIQIINKYKYLEKLCSDYIVDSSSFDFSISVSDEEIEEEKKKDEVNHTNGYLESICLYRKICLELIKYDAFVIHACTIKIDNYAYLLSAKSGTGKTTHSRLLKEYLGDRMTYINGDKPIIRIFNGVPYAFGTPWNGKERYGENTNAQVKAIVFIERAKENSIELINKDKLLSKIINQILIPNNEEGVTKTFMLTDILLNNTKQYILKCNMDISAAICSYNAITKG